MVAAQRGEEKLMSATMPALDAPRGEQVLSVTQLTNQLKGIVESEFSAVWVAGEISNFSRPQSGHCYFTLKDDNAQLRAVIWRGTASRLKFVSDHSSNLIAYVITISSDRLRPRNTTAFCSLSFPVANPNGCSSPLTIASADAFHCFTFSSLRRIFAAVR